MAALTMPSSVPIHSCQVGTSRCSTVATLTSGGGGGLAADVLMLQAAVASNATVNTGPAHMAVRCFTIRLFLLSSLLLCAEAPVSLFFSGEANPSVASSP
jgi:hypothetical protein